MEARALEYFRLHVAPVLSRHSSTHFWNILVSQVGRQEPAVRHALVCISSMYEGLGQSAHRPLVTSRERFAITQYNMSLSRLTSTVTDESIVLLVCLLFICIEMLQGNKDAAIQHCRHGITICNTASKGLLGWAKQELPPIFLRLATFPYFHGVEVADFPEPLGLVPGPLSTSINAEEKGTAWNYLINRAVRLVRLGISYQQGPLRHLPVPDYLFEEQKRSYDSLAVWHHHFRTAKANHQIASEDLESHLHDEMKCVIGKIWVACCLDKDDMVYDNHIGDFEELIQLSKQLIELRSTESGPRPRFIFEMGFLPMLYFIVVKCRRLSTRLAALRYMPLISHEQESLFNIRAMYFVGKASIEIEHGIHLDPHQTEYAGASDAPMPPDEVRVRIAEMTDEIETRKDENGREFEARKVRFVIGPDGSVPGFDKWIEVGLYPGTSPT
ncbi:hypothetical protein VPNG_03401 [Cytospora leucostoma]|uniref:C6 zinc finger domain protein n=1 Tax=Cytospora leucostoma TaxID=1230097 RepID=A0A423XFM3_9PEZI|nr:hypothetical protein VPNG_03401 [Cytospora leucostoma]